MEYVNILSLIMDSDTVTTNGFKSLFKDVPTEYFDDSARISDESIMHKTKDDRFICLYRDEQDCIVLDYLTGGTGSIKSCTKKVKLEFSTDATYGIENLPNDEICSMEDDMLDYRKLIMIATTYEHKRDKININYVDEKEQFITYYFIRKNKNNKFYLQSEVWPTKTPKNKDYEINHLTLYFDINPTFQRMLNGNQNRSFLTELEELDEIENNPELKDLYDFEDIDEDDNDFEYYDETDINTDGFTR